MKTYRVTTRPVDDTEPGAFDLLTQFDPGAWVEPTADTEVYEVHGWNLDEFFENSPGVISYEELPRE